MLDLLLPRAPRNAVPVTLVTSKTYKAWLKRQSARTRGWMKTLDFKAKPGSFCVIPGAKGGPARVVAALSYPASMWDLAALPCPLPKGVYRLEGEAAAGHGDKLALGWLLGAYRYTRYKHSDVDPSKLAAPPGVDIARVRRMADAIALARDLINTPSNDMGPVELAAAIKAEGKKYGAKVTETVGGDKLKTNFPGTYAVGHSSPRAPRFIDLTWGNPRNPKVTLIGKGICFDSGGLDLKPSWALLTEKRDMAGAAIALGIATLVMGNKLPVRLRVLIPAADNAVSGEAFRPNDIITMRDGQTVEVTNTDAEGRLLLADALIEAAQDKPAFIIDVSTLTGAARAALGTEIAALFSNDDRLAAELKAAGDATEDLMWRLPLHPAYDSMLDSAIADMASASNSRYAGTVTAALFLQRFVGKKQPWAHLDFMAWNQKSRSGRPEGGEAMGLRAVYRLIEERFLTR